MSLLDKTFTGKLADGAYTGSIQSYKSVYFDTEKGKSEAVELGIDVDGARFSFVLFEKPFEWAMRDLADTYFSGKAMSAIDILDGLAGKKIAFSLYTNEYAGRKFQRLSFNPNYSQETTVPAGEPDELSFN